MEPLTPSLQLPAARRDSTVPAVYSEQPAGYSGAFPVDVDSSPDSAGLIEYWRILRRRKGTVILIAFIGAAIGFLVTLPQTPVYQARASLEIQDVNQDFMNMKQVSPESQTYNALTDIQTQIKILQSDTLRERTISKLKITKPGDLKLQESRPTLWRRALNLPEPELVDGREAALKAMAKSMKARASGQTRIIEVLADSTDSKLAADFVNTITSEFIDQNMEARWKMSQRTGDWLGRQLDDMRIKLERSEDLLQAYARKAGLLFTGTGNDKDGSRTNVSEDKLRQVQQSLSTATTDRIAKQSRYEMARNSPPEALPDVLNDSSLREYQKSLTDLRRQLAEASSTFTPAHPKVKRLEAQLQTLESALDRERGAIVSRIKNEYEEALRREKLLSADYANQARTVTGEGEKSIQYNILKREVDSNRQLYDAMLQRLKESSIASALKASNVRIVDAAAVPKRPYKPNLPLNAGLAMFAGLFCGVGFVVMRERADRTLQAPGDAPFWLNVPELGAIPSGDHEARRAFSYGRRKAIGPAEPAVESPLQPRIELVTFQHKPSMISEAFRVVLTSILFSGENGNRPRVMVLTSAGAGEGKSTVASNLAIALAEIRKRVLLIDADLRKPRIHTIFELNNECGLVDILQDETAGEDRVSELIQQTSIPGLSVLPSGPSTSAAANLLFAGNMPELLARFRKDFDMILIDTPPMLQMPDARVIGRMADGVLLVTRAGHTTRDAAIAARQRFSEDQTRILGTILNDWNPENSPNGYYGYYKGSYYYNNSYARYGNT